MVFNLKFMETKDKLVLIFMNTLFAHLHCAKERFIVSTQKLFTFSRVKL